MTEWKHLPTEERLLMGPGPSCVHPSVLRALALPTWGHLDPAYVEVMNNTQEMLRQVYGTKNPMTFAVSATGTGGMECTLVNMIEPGDRVLVCIHGYFGLRMAEIARRTGAEVKTIERPWGEAFAQEDIIKEAQAWNPKVVGIVMAETSTGAYQDLEGIGEAVRKNDGFLVCDMVTSMGGMPTNVDALKVDAAYSATQKCLSCPPGLAPVTFSPRAVERVQKRKHPVQSWYLDISLLANYWGGEKRAYHHTAPINMTFGLYEALRLFLDEGAEHVYARHSHHHRGLRAGLEALGLEYVTGAEHTLPMLNAVQVPDGVDEAAGRKELLNTYGIEIGGGLGAFAGKAWRIGLMGHTAHTKNVMMLLAALESILSKTGGVQAASEYYAGA